MRAEAAIAEARSWIGTPFLHAARTKGVGVDCVGVAVASAQASGADVQDTVNYSPAYVDSGFVLQSLRQFCDEVAAEDRQPGDLLLFRVRSNPQHLGVLVSENTFVHAYGQAGKVCETELAPVWLRQLAAVFRPRGG